MTSPKLHSRTINMNLLCYFKGIQFFNIYVCLNVFFSSWFFFITVTITIIIIVKSQLSKVLANYQRFSKLISKKLVLQWKAPNLVRFIFMMSSAAVHLVLFVWKLLFSFQLVCKGFLKGLQPQSWQQHCHMSIFKKVLLFSINRFKWKIFEFLEKSWF